MTADLRQLHCFVAGGPGSPGYAADLAARGLRDRERWLAAAA